MINDVYKKHVHPTCQEGEIINLTSIISGLHDKITHQGEITFISQAKFNAQMTYEAGQFVTSLSRFFQVLHDTLITHKDWYQFRL